MGKQLLFIIVLLMVSSASFAEDTTQKKPHWKTVLESLQEDEKQALELFFRALLKDASGGYVLFGDKPLCVESVGINDHLNKFTSRIFNSCFHPTDIYLRKGYEVLEKLPIKSHKYLIRLFEEPYYHGRELIIVDKKRTEEIVKEHIYLFKYVLGPKLEVNNFLNSLENSNEPFYVLVKNDRVLLGILLGYGIENALRQSRCEYIDESLFDFEQVLPLKSGRVKAELQNYKKRPELEESNVYHRNVRASSFAFSTLFEEKQWLVKDHKSTRDKAPKKGAFPCFGYWECNESEKILNSYSDTQEKLEKVLQSERFLETIFEQLFGT